MAERESKLCANPKCEEEFMPRVYNAIYCGTACRRTITNKNVLARYHAKKALRNTKRTCETDDCGTVLSRYNSEPICEPCKREAFVIKLVSWGWDEDDLRKEMS
jgi:hypothetical protein